MITLTDRILLESRLNEERRLLKESAVAAATGKVIKVFKGNLQNYYNKSLENSRSSVYKSKEKIKAVVSKIEEIDKLKEEISNFKTLVHSGLRWALVGFPNDMLTKSNGVLEDGDIIDPDINLSESILYEADGSVLHIVKLVLEKVRHFFPFNLFVGFEEKITKLSGKALNQISLFLAKVNAIDKPFYFILLPAIIGTLSEIATEYFGESILLNLIPGLEIVLKIISFLSYSVTLITLVVLIINDLEKAAKTAESAQQQSAAQEELQPVVSPTTQ